MSMSSAPATTTSTTANPSPAPRVLRFYVQCSVGATPPSVPLFLLVLLDAPQYEFVVRGDEMQFLPSVTSTCDVTHDYVHNATRIALKPHLQPPRELSREFRNLLRSTHRFPGATPEQLNGVRLVRFGLQILLEPHLYLADVQDRYLRAAEWVARVFHVLGADIVRAQLARREQMEVLANRPMRIPTFSRLVYEDEEPPSCVSTPPSVTSSLSATEDAMWGRASDLLVDEMEEMMEEESARSR